MKTKRIVWTVVFLGITLAAILMEVIAGVWHVAGTIPWTEYLAQYVPWPIQLTAYVVLAVWLPFHFWRHDHMRKAAYIKGNEAARLAAMDTISRHLPALDRSSPAAAAERAAWTKDIAKILRQSTAAPAEVQPGLRYAAELLDPTDGR